MANTLTTILHKILARGVQTLRETVQMPLLVNVDYGTEAAQKGTTIDVPIPKARAARDVAAAHNQSAPTDRLQDLVQIPLDQWKGADFYLTDKELNEIDENEHFIPMEMGEAVRALANSVDNGVHSRYTGIYGYVGTAGTTPFSTLATATQARKVLTEQLAPDDGMRRVLLDPTAEAQALLLPGLTNWDVTGEKGIIINGRLGRKFNMDYFMSQNVTTHTSGTAGAGGAITIGSTQAVGASTINLAQAGVLGSLLVGDVFSVAGATQTYVVKTSVVLTSANVAVAVQPDVVAVLTAGAVVTQKASHTVNLAFHRNAFALATRPLLERTSQYKLGSEMLAMTDPMSGISLRLELKRQNKQTVWDLDILFGHQLVRPAMAARIAG